MIDLKEKDFIAKGTNRACYIDPEDSEKCIKVTISDDFSESQKEIDYYNYLKSNDISWKYIAKHYGEKKTNLGDGEVFDLIRDEDGNISKTLSYYLQKDELTKQIVDPIQLLKNLRKYTLDEGIVVKDLNTKNMLYKKISENTAELILIDGVRNNDFLYYSNRFKFLTNKKINKMWDDFEATLPRKYSFNKYFIDLLKGLK